MNIPRTSRIAAGTLAGILALVPLYGCNNTSSEKESQAKLEKRLKSFVVDSVTKDYPYESIEELLKEEKVSYDPKTVKETWNRVGHEEKEAFFLAYLDSEAFYKSFDEGKKSRYERFFRNGVKPVDKVKIPEVVGIQGNLDEKYSSFSLAVFQIYDLTDRSRFPPIPPVR